MGRPNSGRQTILVGFELDRELLPLLEAKIKEAKTNKREYLQGLVLREFGLKLIPRQVVPAKVVPAKIVPINEEIKSDEDSV